MSDALLARLEAAVARLEKLGGGAAAASTTADGIEVSASAAAAIADFEAFVAGPVKAFVDAASVFPDLAKVVAMTNAAYGNQLALIKAAAVSKKPSDADLLAFLKPSADVINDSGKMDFKSAQYTHQQAFNASAGILSWPFAAPPAPHMVGMLDAAVMYLNRILVKVKDSADEKEKNEGRAYVSTLKALLTGFADYVKTHFKAGLEWNPKGKALSEASASASAAPAAAAKPAAAPAAAAAPVVAAAKPVGMAALFGDLNRGLNITSGLNKVTSDMKAKNQKDLPTLAPTAPAAAAPKPAAAAAAAAPKKPASLELKASTWYCENYEGAHDVKIADLTIKENVYIGGCRNATITITGKAKSIAVDKCFRTTIVFADALSSVEFVNCDRCVVYVQGQVPTVAIDKSKGVIVHLSKTAEAANPDIVTSNISECNIQLEGDESKGEEAVVEVALSEQYLNKVGKNRKITVTPVTHG